MEELKNSHPYKGIVDIVRKIVLRIKTNAVFQKFNFLNLIDFLILCINSKITFFRNT
jgi:uncharacterized membrane protein (DUF373 family)